MRAVLVGQFGKADQLEILTVNDAVPGERAALVEVAYSGVNFVDVYQREGRYPGLRLPWQLGIEGSGIVREVARNCDWKVGDRVAFCTGIQGAYAELVSVPTDNLVRVPEASSLQTAAALLDHGLTALMLCEDVARIKAGTSAVVHAAAGGVGGILVQLLKARGVRVLGVVSSAAKAAWLESRSVEVIRSDVDPGWYRQVEDLTEARGVDAVFDSVGAATVQSSLASLQQCGHLVLFGAASGPVSAVCISDLMAKSLTLSRPVLPHYLRDSAVLKQRAAKLFSAVASGSIELRIHQVLPLAQVREAHLLLESRLTQGKVLLAVNPSLESCK